MAQQAYTIDVTKVLAEIRPEHPMFDTILRHWDQGAEKLQLDAQQWGRLALSKEQASRVCLNAV